MGGVSSKFHTKYSKIAAGWDVLHHLLSDNNSDAEGGGCYPIDNISKKNAAPKFPACGMRALLGKGDDAIAHAVEQFQHLTAKDGTSERPHRSDLRKIK